MRLSFAFPYTKVVVFALQPLIKLRRYRKWVRWTSNGTAAGSLVGQHAHDYCTAKYCTVPADIDMLVLPGDHARTVSNSRIYKPMLSQVSVGIKPPSFSAGKTEHCSPA